MSLKRRTSTLLKTQSESLKVSEKIGPIIILIKMINGVTLFNLDLKIIVDLKIKIHSKSSKMNKM